ncbi:molybdenum cofactor guanylyltransferase [Blastomonas natatoria]|uniref:Molybdenum cofactor guanylyltransferase n=1 Tax=Blastomonas natatoria TaxID=34015 RepID=A0A2V3VAY0_9SPHN|nr:NTP transferase domain-containing protein [Blastomonas natatoria]PXW77908.1 molybdenum cofactor guanylyltransferase [Blastomonas natatoria]
MSDSLPLTIVLAGGQSQRMQGEDKALAEIGGQRMIDRVLDRLRPQSAAIWLSARHDHATGLPHVPDDAAGPAGPVGAIRSVAGAVMRGGGHSFVTCPVDAPFVPHDLVARLTAQGPLAMARTDGAWQPVFALWDARAVLAALPPERCCERWSLQRLGETVGMQAVDFADPVALMNVNTPEDLAWARAHALDESGKRLGAAVSTRYSA